MFARDISLDGAFAREVSNAMPGLGLNPSRGSTTPWHQGKVLAREVNHASVRVTPWQGSNDGATVGYRAGQGNERCQV